MKTRRRKNDHSPWSSVLILWLLFATQLCAAPNNASNQVVTAFNTYKQAVVAQKGQDAVVTVNRKTLDYFEKMLNHILHSSKADVQKLRTADKFLILRGRHQIEANDLKKMTAGDFFAYGIDKGWTTKESAVNLELGRIEVAGDTAKAELIVSGKKAPPAMAYVFSNEDGKWKLDMLPLMARADQMFKQMMRQHEVEENEFIFDLIESVSGTKVSPSVWNPVVEKKK